MELLLWLVALVAGLVVVGTALSLWNSQRAWVRWWDFPRVQLLVLALAPLAGLSPWTEWNGAGLWGESWVPYVWCLTAAASLIQLVHILRYTPLWRPVSKHVAQHRPEGSLCVLICNVYMQNRNYGHLLHLVQREQPDVLLAVEVDEAWVDALQPALDAYPYRILHPLPNTYGMMLLSRRPLRQGEVRFLVQDDVPSIFTQLQLPDGAWVDVYGLHPRPPAPGEWENSKPRDAEVVLVARAVAQANRPAIVMGDLNDVAWSHTTRLFQRLGRLLDPRVGRGLFPTFHARYWFARWPLDHIFHTADWGHIRMTRLPAGSSDHFPILAELQLLPIPDARTLEHPSREDVAEGAEKVAEGQLETVKAVQSQPES